MKKNNVSGGVFESGKTDENIFYNTSEHIEETHTKSDPRRRLQKLRIEESLKEVNKGVWGMPRLSEAKKDVISCDKLRGSANRNYIRRFPNGVTQCTEGALSAARRKQTQGTETSKYLEEEKTI